MKSQVASLLILVLLTSCSSDDSVPQRLNPALDGCLCLNDVQIIGSHNSYKIAVEQAILDYIDQLDPSLSPALEYEHIPLVDQLELGLRNLELDVYYDPLGGRYSDPEGLNVVLQAGKTPLPYDVDNQLEEPGLKMFHIQDVDFRSHHLLFSEG
ncbi:MAG: Ca2+-dependent phosphoinositide-specific phospholipase C, partial [Cyclobacteriaceae bacterium]